MVRFYADTLHVNFKNSEGKNNTQSQIILLTNALP